MGHLYIEIKRQSCLLNNVDQGLMINRQIDLLDRMIKKRARKKMQSFLPHSDVTRNLSANNPKKTLEFFWPNYRLSIVWP